jgi:hypothetical protein
MTRRPVSMAFAASSVLWGAAAAAEGESWHINCYNAQGVLVINIPLAYGVVIDPNGTLISYRNRWLSDDVQTVVKGSDTNCDIGPNR